MDRALPPIDAGDGDDTTTAEAGPPTSRPDDARDSIHATRPDGVGEPDPHTHEDRTVQQQIEPPSRPPGPVPAAGAPLSAPLPTRQPSGAVSTAPAVAPITQTNEIDAPDIADELADELADDADPVEDSITATAPRINHANLMDAAQSGRGVPLVIPGSVEIRSVDPDDMLDETEIRTLPGSIPVPVPATLRGSPAPPASGSTQLPPPRPAAGRPPDTAPDTENDDDGITAQSLAPGMAPDTARQSRGPATQASPSSASSAGRAARAASPRPAAGMPFQPDSVEEPPTRPGVEGALESGEEPATRPGVGESPTRPGKPDPETAERLKRVDVANGYANDGDDEDADDESITARGPVATYEEEEESVTTQAPAMPNSVIEAAITAKSLSAATHASLDDGTDGTTQRVNKTRKPSESSPADGEAESITTQAPGPLTNILRVIASGSSPSLGSDPALPLLDEEEAPENRTAVMANAPLKRVLSDLASASSLPAIRPTGGPLLHGPQGSAAPRLEPSSESGLRVARAGAGAVDRASLGALGLAGDGNVRSSGVSPRANGLASDGSISAPIDRAQMNGDVFPAHVQPSVHDVDLGRGPRYGLLVAIVAVISILVPVTLFLVLHHSADASAAPGVPAEPASEIEKHDGARAKAVRGKNGQLTAPSASGAPSASASASAAPSASASSKPGAKGFPFRR